MIGFFFGRATGSVLLRRCQAVRCKSALRRASLLWAFHFHPSREPGN